MGVSVWLVVVPVAVLAMGALCIGVAVMAATWGETGEDGEQ